MRWALKSRSNILSNKQRTFFDQAQQKKNAGINLAYSHTTSIRREAAGTALIEIAKTNYEFTTDLIWYQLAIQGIHTGENRALGAVMQAGHRAGVIDFTGVYKPTIRPEGHMAPKAVWRSKIYVG